MTKPKLKLKQRNPSGEKWERHKAYLSGGSVWPVAQFWLPGELPARFAGGPAPHNVARLAPVWREIRDTVMRQYETERPFLRPFGYWWIDRTDRPNQRESQAEYLRSRPELLTDLEKQILAAPADVDPALVARLSKPECERLGVPYTPPPPRPPRPARRWQDPPS